MNAREFLTTTQAAIREDAEGRARYVAAMWRWRDDLQGIRNADRLAAYRAHLAQPALTFP